MEEIGVREVGEAEVVEMILKRRYTYEAEIPDEETYHKDLLRFVELVEADPEQASLFEKYFIFQCDSWRIPEDVYIDQPYHETGLSAYYAPLGDKAARFPLCEAYQRCGVSAVRLTKFALAVGATAEFSIESAPCRNNPNASQLVWSAPGNRTRYYVDTDYNIPGLDGLLITPTVELSQLVWNTLCEQPNDQWITARYRNNSSYPPRTAPSQLVCVLRDRAWLPQTDGRFVRPREATRDLLPSGFPFDAGWEWLDAIEFGQQIAEQSEEQLQQEELAKELGFDDTETLDRAKRFAALPASQQQEILAQFERPPVELPEREPANPERRKERVAELAGEAPKRITEERKRRISVNRDGVKQEAGEYLCQQYTTDGEMICQACRGRLPFKLSDGTDYFERVEFLHDLKRHHKQNYLALCPNHAAMFRHANGSTKELKDLVTNASGNEIALQLALREVTVYFTKTHLIDLKAIITADESELETTELLPATVGGRTDPTMLGTVEN